jgi:hypothetical protein
LVLAAGGVNLTTPQNTGLWGRNSVDVRIEELSKNM